jgi:GAF domain-containing protein
MSDTAFSSSDIQAAMGQAARDFPIRSELTLAPLVAFWQTKMGHKSGLGGQLAELVRERIRQAPELCRTIQDPSVIEAHRELVDTLLAAVFAPAFRDQEYGAALLPFRMQSFFTTPLFGRVLASRDGGLEGRVNANPETVTMVRLLHAYALILLRLYGIELRVEYPIVFTASDPETRLDRHFKVLFDRTFLEVEAVGELPELTDETRRRLQSQLMNPDELMALLPPDRFLIRGFTVLRAVDVTHQEVLSSIERDLIDKESIVSAARFSDLQDKLRTLLRRPALQLSLAAIDGDRVLTLNSGASHTHECIFADSTHQRIGDFAGSIFQRASLEGRPLIIEDLATYPDRTRVEEAMLAAGLRNVVVAPLRYQEATIGTLKLASPNPGDLNGTHEPLLSPMLPLFAMAVKRSLDELAGRIQAVIKEKCTAIHPVVEWRFRQAVLNSLERPGAEGQGTSLEIEPIVFRDIYPLYALSDIRGSSSHRAWAIQADLLTQLGLAGDVLRAAHAARPMPILDQLAHRVDTHSAAVEVSLRTGDEIGLVAFLRGEIESLFEHLETFGRPVRERIEAYRSALDPQLGTVGARRRAFDQSVTLVNETISAYLDAEEQIAQAIAPHYFEKQRTDGVDYSIYAGPALLEGGAFTTLHLKNLRLWQIMVACGIAREAERLKPRLPEPIEATHLILVQHTPLSIRFRFDEKRFDVDGAYNVRYEIMKKRIDKAVIRGTTERLTQPGKIAIVYSQETEAAEYRHYVSYLQSLGCLESLVERLELDELQGVSGLRALRVAVNLAAAPLDTRGALVAAGRPSPR